MIVIDMVYILRNAMNEKYEIVQCSWTLAPTF